MENRPVSPQSQTQEEQLQQSLRPTTWDGYFGQHLLKENVQILIEAAKKRGDALDHVLAYGPPGLGKTTLAGHLAVEAERRGDGPVALVDLDPQGSLADWWNARRAETPR